MLREGLALAPNAWLNWMLLGSCLSDLEQYDEALLAYDRAEACRGAERSTIAGWWRATRNDRLLWLLREIRLVRSDDAQYFRVVVHGAISPESELYADTHGYYQSVNVIADSPEGALALYAELEEPGNDVTLSIHEADAIERRPGEVHGVCWMSGRVMYKETD